MKIDDHDSTTTVRTKGDDTFNSIRAPRQFTVHLPNNDLHSPSLPDLLEQRTAA